MNECEYNQEIASIAQELVKEHMQQQSNDRETAEYNIQDYGLHETIDGHQWVIYYSYNDDVIRHSRNDEYYKDIYSNEDVGAIVAEKGLDDLKTMIAFWCMYADVQERLEQAFDEFESASE